MKLDMTYLNGTGTNVRGKPALTLLFKALDEWIEYNTTVPEEIHISHHLSELLAKENPYGVRYYRVLSIIGEHILVESKDLKDYEIKFVVY